MSSDPLTIIHGDALSTLKTWRDESVQCVVTSPPYFGLRSYGTEPVVWGGDADCTHQFVETRQYQDSPIRTGDEGVGFHDAKTTKEQRWRVHSTCTKCGGWDGELGAEPTLEMYVTHVVDVFSEVKRVLRADGTLWLNLGDSYFASGQGFGDTKTTNKSHNGSRQRVKPDWKAFIGLKPKDLMGVPWRVAFALQSHGWYLRSDIIWSKPNPMPESVTDRPTRAHEYVFLLSKSQRYFYDADAIRENWTCDRDDMREKGVRTGLAYLQQGPIANNSVKPKKDKQRGHPRRHAGFNDRWDAIKSAEQSANGRNKRSVWTIATKPFPDAHFATFPTDLVTPCVLAGSKAGDTVLDPFAGSGTTGKVAIELGRKAILIEPKAEYIEMIQRRCQTTIGLPLAI